MFKYYPPLKYKCYQNAIECSIETAKRIVIIAFDRSEKCSLKGSVMEGMYWKRRMEAVCAQYKRWRHFNKGRKKGRKRVSQ